MCEGNAIREIQRCRVTGSGREEIAWEGFGVDLHPRDCDASHRTPSPKSAQWTDVGAPRTVPGGPGMRSLEPMGDAKELVALLAQLPDTELAGVVEAATDGKPALAALHAVAQSLAATLGHAPDVIDVTPDTLPAEGYSQSETVPASGQVGAGPVAGRIPVPPAGIPSAGSIGGYSSSGVPTFESVRDKVEQRYGTSQGMGELDRQTPVGRSVEEQWDARAKAARERLEPIRKSVHGNDSE